MDQIPKDLGQILFGGSDYSNVFTSCINLATGKIENVGPELFLMINVPTTKFSMIKEVIVTA